MLTYGKEAWTVCKWEESRFMAGDRKKLRYNEGIKYIANQRTDIKL
jgi:hypothetical protein